MHTQLSDCLIFLFFNCRIVEPRQLFFSGSVRGESAMKSLEDIGSPVDFDFVVRTMIFFFVFRFFLLYLV